MVKARRAKPRPLHIAIPLITAAVLIGAGVFAANRINGSRATATGPTPTVAATESTAPPSPASQPESAPGPTTSTVAPPAGGATGTEQLAACQQKVRAADAVLKAGRTGVLHWAAHVQAQTDANRGRISEATMKKRFAATRVLGPGDQARYAKAKRAHAKLDGSCAKVSDADPAVADKLGDCQARVRAQKPVLAAAAAGMADWRSHLAAMQRSREGHVANAQGIWLRAWRSAPPHIKAYKRAAANFDAPSC